MTARLYIASWDTLGFECLIDLTSYDQKAMWASLADQQVTEKLPVREMIMRAKFNSLRFPEIWTFHSEVDIETLRQYTKDSPQALVNAIRKHGTTVFVTSRQKELIK